MLYDFQKQIIKEIISFYKQGHRQILVCSPCGSGKSYIIKFLLDRATGPALTICHRKELKLQHEKLMPEHHFELPITAYNMLKRNEIGNEILLINDEVHLALADTWNALIDHYKAKNTFTLGFSATPERLDGKPFNQVFTALIKGPSVKWLIENKFLAPFKYFCPQIPGLNSISQAARNSPEGNIDEYNELFKKKGVLGHVVQTYEKFLNNKKVIIYCVNKQHAKDIAESFQNAGLQAMSIDSDDSQIERENLMEDFRNSRIKILCNCGLLSEGISILDLEGVMLCRPTSSYALFVQQSMRPLRINPKVPEKTATIIDMVNNYVRHGLPDEEHEFTLQGTIKKRKTEFNEEGNFNIRYCKTCFQAFKTSPKCPYCNTIYELEQREIQEHKNIEIAEIKENQKNQKRLTKQSFDLELKRCNNESDAIKLAIKYGYNPAYGQIRWRHGRGRWI